MFKIDCPVYPIMPSFNQSGGLDLKETEKYIHYLEKGGAKCLMTTAGTSQFNLLSNEEIYLLNESCCRHPGKSILGISPLNLEKTRMEIDFLASSHLIGERENTAILLFFPERYYNNRSIVEYFHECASLSPFPVLIHGMPMKRASGGQYEYSFDLVKEIYQHPNIVGMKEESSSFDVAFDLISKIKNDNRDFITIVAGKSQRRFLSLYPAGATTFLSGLGSIHPRFDEDFYDLIKESRYPEAIMITNTYETPLFDQFMGLGWHMALREALKQKGLGCAFNRHPFPTPTEQESRIVSNVLFYLRISSGTNAE